MWPFLLLAALAASVSPQPLAVPAAEVQAFDVEIPVPPAPVRIGDERHLIYEMHLTNFAAVPLRLERIAVRDTASGAELLALSESALEAALGHVPSGHGTLLAPGARSIAYLDVTLAADGATPTGIKHSLAVRKETDNLVIEAGPAAIDTRPLPLLGPPLRAGPWVAVYAPELERGHRRVAYAVAGRATIPGRFAIDWMKTDARGRLDRSDGKTLADSLSYGAEVLAVADAVVAETRDEFTEPRLRAELPKVSIGDAAGNFIVLDLGDGRYAFYEHLQPGLGVRPGDRVKRGQVIARVGLTGQGTAPHLHFHLASAPSPLGAEGLPYLLEGAAVIGGYRSIANLGAPWHPLASAVTAAMFPPANSVVSFPE